MHLFMETQKTANTGILGKKQTAGVTHQDRLHMWKEIVLFMVGQIRESNEKIDVEESRQENVERKSKKQRVEVRVEIKGIVAQGRLAIR